MQKMNLDRRVKLNTLRTSAMTTPVEIDSSPPAPLPWPFGAKALPPLVVIHPPPLLEVVEEPPALGGRTLRHGAGGSRVLLFVNEAVAELGVDVVELVDACLRAEPQSLTSAAQCLLLQAIANCPACLVFDGSEQGPDHVRAIPRWTTRVTVQCTRSDSNSWRWRA